MSSIIDTFNKNKYNYTAKGSSNTNPYIAFDKSGQFYVSSTLENYWQISFDRLVVIESYFITAKPADTWYMNSWTISYTYDSSTYYYLKGEFTNNLRGNANKFKLTSPIVCNGFKITSNSASDESSDMLFYSFDCFGSILPVKPKNKCSCNYRFYKRRLVTNILLVFYSSIVSS